MTAAVRIFWHAGLTTATVAASSNRYSTDSVAMLKQPYEGRELISASTGSAASTQPAPKYSKIVFVQVQEGKAVHYEINPENRNVAADTSSPILTGSTQFEAGPNWSLSFLEHVAT